MGCRNAFGWVVCGEGWGGRWKKREVLPAPPHTHTHTQNCIAELSPCAFARERQARLQAQGRPTMHAVLVPNLSCLWKCSVSFPSAARKAQFGLLGSTCQRRSPQPTGQQLCGPLSVVLKSRPRCPRAFFSLGDNQPRDPASTFLPSFLPSLSAALKFWLHVRGLQKKVQSRVAACWSPKMLLARSPPPPALSYLAFPPEKMAGKSEDDLGIQAESSDLQQAGVFPRGIGRLRGFLKSHRVFVAGGRGS